MQYNNAMKCRARARPPPPPPLPPLLTDAPALQLADAPPLQLADGEALGGPSPAVVCVLMPVRSNNLGRAVRAVRAWERARAAPCGGGGAGSSDAAAAAAAVADLAFFHSQSYEGEDMCRSRWKVPSALPEDGAPAASPDDLKARGAPTHPGAPPEPPGGSP